MGEGNNYMERYKHTETGWTMIAILAVVAAVPLAMQALVPASGQGRAVYFVPLFMAVVLANFYKLTVTVDEQAVSLAMGIGLIRKKFPLAEISAAGVNHNPMLSGWGIHLTRDGWLYNVNSQVAVKLEMKNGRSYQIGSDEPQALLTALRNAGIPAKN